MSLGKQPRYGEDHDQEDRFEHPEEPPAARGGGITEHRSYLLDVGWCGSAGAGPASFVNRRLSPPYTQDIRVLVELYPEWRVWHSQLGRDDAS